MSTDTEDRYYGADALLNLNDVVLPAKFHRLIGTQEAPALPLITTLLACQKFGNNILSPNMSLQILQDYKQQISETMNCLLPRQY